MQDELFDELDCAGRKTGKVIGRSAAHASGAWHGAFHCLIISSSRAGRPAVLFQKRSPAKRIAPGRYDVSAGGHYAAGEGPNIAGPREIREELGIAVSFDQLVPIGRRIFVYCFEPGIRELEFQDVYLLSRDIRPEDLSLQREELEGIILLELEQGISLLSGAVHQARTVLHGSDGGSKPIQVRADGFVPCLDRYYLKLLLLARRYLAGERGTLVI